MNNIIEKVKQNPQLIVAVFIAFVFLQSLFFKYQQLFGAPHPATFVIFETIGKWMQSIGLDTIGSLFATQGAVLIGTLELIAAILLIKSATRPWGFLLALGLMGGAIFFHIFTPLGLFPYTDPSCMQAGCHQEKALFFMAVIVFVSSAYFVYKDKAYFCSIVDKIRGSNK